MKPIQKLFIAATVTVSLCGWTPPALAQNPDTDGDYLSDSDETNIYHTDPNNPDTDGDGRTDWQEVYETTDPLNPASKSHLAGGCRSADRGRLSKSDGGQWSHAHSLSGERHLVF